MNTYLVKVEQEVGVTNRGPMLKRRSFVVHATDIHKAHDAIARFLDDEPLDRRSLRPFVIRSIESFGRADAQKVKEIT